MVLLHCCTSNPHRKGQPGKDLTEALQLQILSKSIAKDQILSLLVKTELYILRLSD